MEAWVEERLGAEHLPVAKVITEFFIEDGLPLVVGVEVEVEGVDDAGALVVDDDAAGYCAVSFTVRVWADLLSAMVGS